MQFFNFCIKFAGLLKKPRCTEQNYFVVNRKGTLCAPISGLDHFNRLQWRWIIELRFVIVTPKSQHCYFGTNFAALLKMPRCTNQNYFALNRKGTPSAFVTVLDHFLNLQHGWQIIEFSFVIHVVTCKYAFLQNCSGIDDSHYHHWYDMILVM